MVNNETDYSYIEPSVALETRINMHKKYSSFSLEKYLSTSFNYKNKRVLDIGAGDGNFSLLLGKESELYIGIEKNETSIEKAHINFEEYKNIFFIKEDMDNEFYLPKNSFDYIFFIYSSYYTNDPEKLFTKVYDLLKSNGGTLVLIGPSSNNAWEVDDFCHEIFNREKASGLRNNRIVDEFKDKLKEFKFDVEVNKINFNLKFPNFEEYLLYIKSTLQYRESFNKNIVVDENKLKDILINKFNLTLTKEVVSLCAKK